MEKYFSAKRERYQETVLNLYFKEGKSVGQISRILPLSPETIRRWCITFASGNEKAFIQMKRKKDSSEVPVGTDGTKSEDVKELQAEIKRLQRDLRMELSCGSERGDNQSSRKASSTFTSEKKKLAPSSSGPARKGRQSLSCDGSLQAAWRNKQAYFKRDESSVMKKAARESFAIEYIRNVREKDPGIGGMKLWHMYRRYFNGNAPLGRDSFEDIVHRHGLKVRQKTRRPRTTDSHTRIAGIPRPGKGPYPHLRKLHLGGRHHLHTHMARQVHICLLLCITGDGFLYERNHRLEHRPHTGGVIPYRGTQNGLVSSC